MTVATPMYVFSQSDTWGHWVVGKLPGRSEGVCETMTDSLAGRRSCTPEPGHARRSRRGPPGRPTLRLGREGGRTGRPPPLGRNRERITRDSCGGRLQPVLGPAVLSDNPVWLLLLY